MTLFAAFGLSPELARGEGKYQSTRDGKTLVWNSDAKPGDAATWSGDRDRNDYAKGFGRLVWYVSGVNEPELYARYWGRMVDGKFEGPVNVHAKKKTRYAIFIEGRRVTGWKPGTAPTNATAQWQTLAAKRSRMKRESGFAEESASTFAKASDVTTRRDQSDFANKLRRDEPSSNYGSASEREREPEAPAAGPAVAEISEVTRHMLEAAGQSLRDLYNERWPKVDIDDSLRLLAFPPRTLRSR
jgi:hypothetical protein